MPSARFIILVRALGAYLFAAGILTGCNPKGLARIEGSSRDQSSSPSSPIGTETIETETAEVESVVPPANISGAYLVKCDNFEAVLPAGSATRVLCALEDQAGKKASVADVTWNLEPAPGTNNLLGQELLPAVSNWHVEFLLRSDYFQQNTIEVLATLGAQGRTIRLGKDRFTSAQPSPSLALRDRTTDMNHQAVAAGILGSRDAWDKIYQDPVSLLFVSNPLHGDLPFVESERICTQLDSNSLWQGAWRLPSLKDLTRLHQLGADKVAGFSDWFWSGETAPNLADQAYYEILNTGQIGITPKVNSAMAFFCVADQLQAGN